MADTGPEELNDLQQGGGMLLDQADDEVPAQRPVPVPQTVGLPELKKGAKALRSVLKVFVSKVDPNYSQPWQMCPQRSSSGSAFVINAQKRQILSNSHVVSNATAIYVRRPGVAKKFKAEVICEGKPVDLALLTVRDEAFWEPPLQALEFVDVPELQSPIAVAGYPVGGDSLSITKGIVSRLTQVRYSSATARLLSIQIDAAINPGNSGGPAFSDLEASKVAGVAFSKNTSTSTDNIGYIIPWRVVRHFLVEAEASGSYVGVPDPGFVTQDMENPSQRAYLRVPEHRSGVVVVHVDPLSAAQDVLQVNDVILQVEGTPIADDGTVVFRDDERLDYGFVFREKHIGDSCQLKILRDGQELDVVYELRRKDSLVPVLHGVDCVPSYLIVGGLVFMPLTSPFLEMVFYGAGKRGRRSDIPVPVLQAFNTHKTHKGQQVVILVQVLAHELNHGYKYSVVPTTTFNGTEIRNLRHLADLVDGCSEQYLNFGLDGGRLITLDRADAAKHGPQILAMNAINTDRSQDLLQPAGPEDRYDWEETDASNGHKAGTSEAMDADAADALPGSGLGGPEKVSMMSGNDCSASRVGGHGGLSGGHKVSHSGKFNGHSGPQTKLQLTAAAGNRRGGGSVLPAWAEEASGRFASGGASDGDDDGGGEDGSAPWGQQLCVADANDGGD